MKAQPSNTYEIQKAVLKWNFIGMNAYIKNTESFQVNDWILHLKFLGKQKKKSKPKTSRREIIKNKCQKQQNRDQQKKGKLVLWKKIKKIDKSKANLTKGRKEKTKISKIRNRKWG
jgi:hypothetical protein